MLTWLTCTAALLPLNTLDIELFRGVCISFDCVKDRRLWARVKRNGVVDRPLRVRACAVVSATCVSVVVVVSCCDTL